MQIIKRDESKCFSPRYDIKGVEDKPAPNQSKGIAGYGQIWGWILKKLGFAISLKDKKNNTIYLNKVSASKWLNRNEDKCDPADKEKLYRKINSLVIQKPEKASSSRDLEPIDSPTINLEELPRDIHLLISKELFYKDAGALALASHKLQKNTHEELLTKKLLNLKPEEDPRAFISFVKDNLKDRLNYAVLKDFSAERKWVIFKILSPIWHPFNANPDRDLENPFLTLPIAQDLGFQLAKDFLENPKKFPPSAPEYDRLIILDICYHIYAKSVGAFDALLKKHFEIYQLTNSLPDYQDSNWLYNMGPAIELRSHLTAYYNAYQLIKELKNLSEKNVPETLLRLGMKICIRDHRILTHLISGLATKEALKVALQEIPQEVSQQHKDWYLQALTKGLKRQDSTGNIKEFLPNLTPDEIEDILQELGIVERAKGLALVGGDEYHKLFGRRISEDPNAPPDISFRGQLYY